jgi:hypothetical protein
MGERRARWGYGYQDKVATERLLNFLRRDLRDGTADFEAVRLSESEVPEGFVIVLSGQPQSWQTSFPLPWRQRFAQDGRRIDVSGLSRPEVHTLVSKLAKPTTGEERDDIYDATLGNLSS